MIRIKYIFEVDDNHYEMDDNDGFSSFMTSNESSHIFSEEPNADLMLDHFKLFLLGLGYSPVIAERIKLLDIDQIAKLQLTGLADETT